MYDERTPWVPFHIALPPPESIHDRVEHLQPPDFFLWDGFQSQNGRGGRWNLPRLQQLLQRRHLVEQTFEQALERSSDPKGAKLRSHYGAFLPYLDPLSHDMCRSWTSWGDGRDAVAHTIRYVAEMGALINWLKELRFQSQDVGDLSPRSTDNKFLGSWMGSVKHHEHWRFLFHSPLPLYGLFVLDEGHPLRRYSKEGYLHGDELYRTPGLVHYLKLGPTAYKPNFYSGSTRVLNSSSALRPSKESYDFQLPRNLRVSSPGGRLLTQSSIEWGLPFHSYPFLDNKIRRELPEFMSKHYKDIVCRFKQLAKATTNPILSEWALKTKSRRMPVHPLATYLIPKQRGSKMMVFEEVEEDGIRYPLQIFPNQQKARRDSFDNKWDLGSNVFLWSIYPWPMVDDVQIPAFDNANDDSDDEHVVYMVPVKRCIYNPGPPSQKQRDKQLKAKYQPLAPAGLLRAQQNEPGTSYKSSSTVPATLAGRNEWPATPSTSVPSFSLSQFVRACGLQPRFTEQWRSASRLSQGSQTSRTSGSRRSQSRHPSRSRSERSLSPRRGRLGPSSRERTLPIAPQSENRAMPGGQLPVTEEDDSLMELVEAHACDNQMEGVKKSVPDVRYSFMFK